MSAQDSDIKLLRAAVERWTVHLRSVQSVQWLPRGLAAGLVIALALALVARFWPIASRMEVIRWSIAAGAAGILLALVGVWAWRRPLIDTARRFDRLFGLRERVSTALELSENVPLTGSGTLVSVQRDDALRAIEGVRPAQVLRFTLDWREWALSAIVLGLLVLAVTLPNPQDDVLAEQAAVQEAITEQIKTLEELRLEALEDAALTDEERAAIVETLDEAIVQLSQDDLSLEEGVATMDAAEQELRDLAEQSAAERAEDLQTSAGDFEDAGLEGVAEALSDGNFEQAADSLFDDMPLGDMSAEEIAEFAAQLSQLADQLAGVDAELAQALQDAANALEQNDLAGAQQALEGAAQALADATTSSSVSQYADKAQKGQAELANAPMQPGQSAGNQPGMGQAQTNSGNQGQGQEGQPGTGQGQGEGSGLDSGQEAGETPRGGGAPDGGEKDPEIFAPQRIGGEGGDQVDIPGNPGTGIPISEGDFVDNPTGQAMVPYSQVWGNYSAAANEALDSGYIPLGMRSLIQSYFTRLEPGQ